jgi:hypothetical protein
MNQHTIHVFTGYFALGCAILFAVAGYITIRRAILRSRAEPLHPNLKPTSERYDSDLLKVTMPDGTIYYVCDTCGGNCGQCGITGKLSRLNPNGTPAASLDWLVKATHMDQPVAGLTPAR